MDPTPSSASAPAPKKTGEQYGKNFISKSGYSQGSLEQRDSKPPSYTKCCRIHSGVCREGTLVFVVRASMVVSSAMRLDIYERVPREQARKWYRGQ